MIENTRTIYKTDICKTKVMNIIKNCRPLWLSMTKTGKKFSLVAVLNKKIRGKKKMKRRKK